MATAVRVVCVALDRYAEQLDELAAGLPPAERDARPQLRRSRAAAREVLARTIGVGADTLELSRVCERCGDPRHGKPALRDHSLAFNVSHSDDVALIALADAGRVVGVDIEALKPRTLDLERLAARTMNGDELAAWRGVPAADRLEAFLRCWTAKEAYLKAIGIGIAQNLREVAVPSNWTVTLIDGLAGYVASLAVDADDVAVSFEAWRN